MLVCCIQDLDNKLFMCCTFTRTVFKNTAYYMENNTYKDNVFEVRHYNASVTSSSSNGATPLIYLFSEIQILCIYDLSVLLYVYLLVGHLFSCFIFTYKSMTGRYMSFTFFIIISYTVIKIIHIYYVTIEDVQI